MKVLQVNCVYKKGSTGKITYDLHKGLLDAGVESIVCYGRGEFVDEPGVYKTCSEWYSKLNNAFSRITGILYGGCFFSTNKLISIIKKEKPDVVHLQCINGYFVNIYRLVTWLKKNHIKTVLTLHAEFMYTANCGHALDCDRWKTGCGSCPHLKSETKSLLLDGTSRSWKKMRKAFEGFDENLIVTSVSPWLMERAKQSPILRGKNHCVVYNGLDTNVFHPYDTDGLREKHNCVGKKVVFHATPAFSADPNHFKGGYYVLELARSMPEVQFIIAGNCVEEINSPENVILLGRITDQKELARYYSMADVTVIASKKETFSMIVAESLCSGTPVVGFKAGGPEQIAIPEYSQFVEYGDLSKMADGIQRFFGVQKGLSLPVQAAERYATGTMIHGYCNCYQHVTGTTAGRKND